MLYCLIHIFVSIFEFNQKEKLKQCKRIKYHKQVINLIMSFLQFNLNALSTYRKVIRKLQITKNFDQGKKSTNINGSLYLILNFILNWYRVIMVIICS